MTFKIKKTRSRNNFLPQTIWYTTEDNKKESEKETTYCVMLINSAKNNRTKQRVLNERLNPDSLEEETIKVLKKGKLECKLLIAKTNKPPIENIRDLIPGSAVYRDKNLETITTIKELKEYAQGHILPAPSKNNYFNW